VRVKLSLLFPIENCIFMFFGIRSHKLESAFFASVYKNNLQGDLSCLEKLNSCTPHAFSAEEYFQWSRWVAYNNSLIGIYFQAKFLKVTLFVIIFLFFGCWKSTNTMKNLFQR
jgi:hypothetical protein